MRELARVRSFPALFTGQTASMIGDSLMMLVLAVWAKDITGSNSVAGLTMFFMAVPFLSAPVTGWLVDKVDRRKVLIVGNLVAGLVILPLFAVEDHTGIWLIYGVSVFYGWSFLVLSSALDGVLKDMVPDEHLAAVNGALTTVKQGSRLLGPISGIGLYAVLGPHFVVLLNLLSFVVAAVAMSVVRVHGRTLEEPREREPWTVQVTAGLRHITSSHGLRSTVVAVALSMLMLGMIEAVGFTLVDEGLRQPTAFVGVIVAAQGSGALLGGLIAAKVIKRYGELVSLGFAHACVGVSIGAMATASVTVVLACMFLMGVGLPISAVAGRTLLQRRTPAEIMGRTSAAFDALTGIPQTLSIAAGAGLVSVVDYRVLLGLMGGVILAAGCYAWRVGGHGARTSRIR